MQTFSTLQTKFQSLANDTTAAPLTQAKLDMNMAMHMLESDLGYEYMEVTRTGTTTTSDTINLPNNFIRLKVFYVTVSGVRYIATPVLEEDLWQQLKTIASAGNVLLKIFLRKTTIEMYPTPATGGEHLDDDLRRYK